MLKRKKNLPQTSTMELLNPWLEQLSEQGKAQVIHEIERQQRALNKMLYDSMPQRTARRIIKRSQHRVNYIIADELVKKKKR